MLLSSLAGEERLDRPRLQQALSSGRSPLVLTSRTGHLDYLAGRLGGVCPHIFTLKGGMGTKQRKKLAESLAAVLAMNRA